jgi:ribose transport system substrate-binding protein
MTKVKKVAGTILTAAFAISGVYMTSKVIDKSPNSLPRVLMVGHVPGEAWERTLVGARAAAKEFGVELQAEAPAPGQTVEQQCEAIRKIRPADFAGVAVSFEDPASQVDMINDLAGRTKLVTWGKDSDNAKQLCHIGFSQLNAGAKAASMAYCELAREGQVALLTTATSAAQDEPVRQRLAGFQERWALVYGSVSHYPVVTVAVGAGEHLSERLADPKLALIVAFDTEAAESALKATADWPESKRIPIIALDASESILNAIAEGRIASALFNDTYEDGYDAIRQLAMYCHTDDAGLPIPGLGKIPRSGEIVQKSNVADIRRRMDIASKVGDSIPQVHLSSREFNASLLAH